jgi:glycosyltransferase involved in cell wall biosynthesis
VDGEPRGTPADSTAAIRPHVPLRGAPPKVAAQRVVRRVLRWYLGPVVEDVNRHNQATAAVLAEHRRELSRLRLGAEVLQRDVDLRRGDGVSAGGASERPDGPRRIAIVVVRFGEGITGGAELHARLVGTRLAERGHDVTVLTTCAEDYVSWANVLPPGETPDGPLRVVRFPVRAERDLVRWEAAMQPILRRIWTDEDEERLLREQGPDVPALLDHLATHAHEYDVVIFFTLLYLPTVAGIPLVSDRAIVVPTLHDEAASHLDAQARALCLARWVMWNSPEEQALAQRLYGVDDLPGAVAGVGVEVPPDAAARATAVRARFGLDRPYLLYAGRVDPDKGCAELIDHFMRWSDDRADLVLAGRAWMAIPDHPRIRHLGYVESPELWALMAGATGTVQPSRNESLSMASLESLAAGTPIVVTAGSQVLVGHARRSGAGLVYRDAAQFATAVTRLLDDTGLRTSLGRAGQTYIAEHFTWDRVMALYDHAIRTITTGSAA